jgi:hypothetical protein
VADIHVNTYQVLLALVGVVSDAPLTGHVSAAFRFATGICLQSMTRGVFSLAVFRYLLPAARYQSWLNDIPFYLVVR